MAIFSKTTKTVKKADTTTALVPRDSASDPRLSASSKKHSGDILLAPRITEKGSYLIERGVYVFDVTLRAGKKQIAAAIHEVFGVVPAKIRTAKVMSKSVISRSVNRVGRTSTGKKAYVYLKKGDKIEII